MFYDLNVPWSSNQLELQQRIAFLAELGYRTIALSTIFPHDHFPASYTSPIKLPQDWNPPHNVKILTRCTVLLVNPSQQPRLADVKAHFDILALRPTDEKTLLQACSSIDADIVSLDLSIRYQTHFKYNTFSAASERGVKIELCYAPGLALDEADKKRNVFQNAASIIRVTRGGRGIIISSEANSAFACRGPHDVINMAVIWGLKQDVAAEAVGEASRNVVAAAQLRKRSYRGAVDVVFGGEPPSVTQPPSEAAKRKPQTEEENHAGPLSKRAKKKLAKQAKEVDATTTSL